MDEQQAHAAPTARIRAGMKVVAADGSPIGTVAAVEKDEIMLASDGGMMVPLSLIEAVEDDRVIVRGRGDNSFGEEA